MVYPNHVCNQEWHQVLYKYMYFSYLSLKIDDPVVLDVQ
jgi:hypothetical protein